MGEEEKQKVIFLDPLAIRGGKNPSFGCCKFTKWPIWRHGRYLRTGASTAPPKQTKQQCHKTFKEESSMKPASQEIIRRKMGARQFFDKFGTKVMTSLAYGIKPVTRRHRSHPATHHDGWW
jgi:hypothetical protein